MRICDKLVRDVLENPCVPSPCGLNSQCRVVQDHAVCSCTPGYIGSAPNCRPECVVSSECAQDRACVKQKCVDPCPSTCGLNARCQVVNHNPICSCSPGFTGDPFIQCSPERKCPIQSIWLTHHPHQLQSIQCQNKSRFTLTETFLIIRDTLWWFFVVFKCCPIFNQNFLFIQCNLKNQNESDKSLGSMNPTAYLSRVCVLW